MFKHPKISSQRKSWSAQRYTARTTVRCVSVALVDQKDKYHESSGTCCNSAILHDLLPLSCYELEHCLVYSCFTTNRKDLFHILTVQVAIGNWKSWLWCHKKSVSVSYLSPTSDSLTVRHVLYFLGGYLNCQMQSLGYVVSVLYHSVYILGFYCSCSATSGWEFETLILVLFPQLGLA